MTALEINASVDRLLPATGPALLALETPASRDLLFARVPAAQLEWTPAAHFAEYPVIPMYAGASARCEVQMGKSIDSATLMAIPTSEGRLDYLRWRTSLLAERRAFKPETAAPLRNRRTKSPEPVAAPVSPDTLAREVAALEPGGCQVAAHGCLQAFLARATEIPGTLAEIGRLREIAFRAAGEGTGRAFDLDRFDYTYFHLFVWNRETSEIAGAYRLSPSDGGPESLYTATLFQYGPEFLERLGPAIELGRSFIRLEYQKSFAPLLLLWKGIGRFITAHPRYRTLFGPVSISNQYQSISRELMIAFLERREWLADLAGLVRPRNAPQRRAMVPADYCRSLDELSDIVADIEPGTHGVPVLLRHYLRLGGKLLGFNVDPDFANALDGLIVVDLTKTEPRLLERYLGKPEAAGFLAHWKGTHAPEQESYRN